MVRFRVIFGNASRLIEQHFKFAKTALQSRASRFLGNSIYGRLVIFAKLGARVVEMENVVRFCGK